MAPQWGGDGGTMRGAQPRSAVPHGGVTVGLCTTGLPRTHRQGCGMVSTIHPWG